jgi:hypothetical protein
MKAADQLAAFADPAGTALPGDLDVSDAQGREAVVRNAPVGLGMPVFDKLEADLAKAVITIAARPPPSKPKVATTHASSPAPCRWWRWCWRITCYANRGNTVCGEGVGQSRRIAGRA